MESIAENTHEYGKECPENIGDHHEKINESEEKQLLSAAMSSYYLLYR